MAGTRPSMSLFDFWLPMQELTGTRYDASGNARHATISGWGGGWTTPDRAAGHVQAGAADFDSGSSHNLKIADASWQSGDVDKCCGGWFYLSSASWILMSKGGNSTEVANYVLFGASSRIYFEVGDDGGYTAGDGYGYNGSYPVVDLGWSPSTSTWYYVIWRHDASANTSYIYIWDTSGSLVASDSTPLYCTWTTNDSSYGIFFGTGGNSTYHSWPISINSNKPNGRMEQWFMYNGMLSSDNMTWLVNGGAGRTWRAFQDSVSVPTQFFKDIRHWLARDGSLRNERIIEELWNRNQMGLPLPVRSRL